MFIRQFVSMPNNGIRPILNEVPQLAAAAWGFRLLKSDYAGACCVVKRQAGDNLVIGFVPDGLGNMVVDEAAIAAFCGITLGFIRILYDQSGNGQDLQGGAQTTSPMIYNGTSVVKVNGKPAMDFFINSDRRLLITGANIPIVNATVLMTFSTTNVDANSRRVYALTESLYTDGSIIGVSTNGGSNSFSIRYPTPQTALTQISLPLGQKSYFGNKIGTNYLAMSTNGGPLSTNVNTQANFTIDTMRLGGSETGGLGFSFNGFIQEFIFWDNDANPSRTIMNNNLSQFYGI